MKKFQFLGLTLRSFVKVKPKNWNFLIMGYGQDESLKEKIVSYSSLPNVFIYPPVFDQDKWKFLSGSDLFVLFSHRENFGFSVAEAASVGLPVYISTGVDIYPFFENERERLVFDISTEQDIEKALSTLDKISDDDLQYIGSFCREIALKNFSFEQFSGNLK
ncbi:MAG: glycosyltransferase, partial [Microcystis panniformis]